MPCFYPTNVQSFVKATSFDGDSRDVFLEREEFSGSILKQLESAYGFLTSHDKFKTEYDGLRRIDYDDYPKQALREAAANAIAHREYALSGPTLISVMPSFVEITSLGGLVAGITQEDLEANISMPRNKLLAALMYRLGIIEAWGTGIGRMRAAYNNLDAAVEISVTPNTFTVKLLNRNAEINVENLQQKKGGLTKAAESNPGKASELSLGKATGLNLDKATELNPDKEAVLKAVQGGCSARAEIQKQTGFSQSKTIGLLRELVSGGVLQKRGASKSTRYALA